MNRSAFSRCRLPTATSVVLPLLRIASQFLRAMFDVPRIPKRQTRAAMNLTPCVVRGVHDNRLDRSEGTLVLLDAKAQRRQRRKGLVVRMPDAERPPANAHADQTA